MIYSIEFSDTARKQIKKLDKSVSERIVIALERLRIQPQSYLTKLVGETGYRLRVGDYRIIIDIYHERLTIIVIRLGHRSKVYN